MEPELWPAVWLSIQYTETLGKPAVDRNGARVRTLKNADLQYSCPCGATFTRQRGEQISETRLWVSEHTPHLPIEEQV